MTPDRMRVLRPAAVVVGSLVFAFLILGIQQFQNFLTLGAIYALVALGYTMVYGIIELINFAHGDVFTLSAFYAILFERCLRHFGFDLTSLATSNLGGFLVALLALLVPTMLAAGITGVLIERVAYRRLRNAARLAPLITAIGVSFLLEGVMFADFGSSNYPTNKTSWVTGTAFTLKGVGITWTNIFVFFMALAMMLLLQAFVTLTRLGKAMRATAQDRDAALLNGININRTIAATFFIGSALAAAGAVVYSIKERVVVWNLGFQFGIIAFTSAVLGGIGNIVGAGLGGFLIGVISTFGGQLIGQEWSNSIVFAMLIIVLTFRPVGLLGLRVPDRA
jgi:branched-chain amino acid transport system permease protein